MDDLKTLIDDYAKQVVVEKHADLDMFEGIVDTVCRSPLNEPVVASLLCLFEVITQFADNGDECANCMAIGKNRAALYYVNGFQIQKKFQSTILYEPIFIQKQEIFNSSGDCVGVLD